jgi:hypothetical protein
VHDELGGERALVESGPLYVRRLTDAKWGEKEESEDFLSPYLNDLK